MIKGICTECKEVKRLDVHHRDGNHSNDIPSNRIALCSRCHHLAHVELNIQNTGRPGTKPLSEKVYGMPRFPFEEVKKQYDQYFPRVTS